MQGQGGATLDETGDNQHERIPFGLRPGLGQSGLDQSGPGKSKGNTVTIPVQIEVPPRPGETLRADVTFQGNGQQQFVVPVTLAVEAADPELKASADGRSPQVAAGWSSRAWVCCSSSGPGWSRFS